VTTLAVQWSPTANGLNGPEDIAIVDLRSERLSAEVVVRHDHGTTLQFPVVDQTHNLFGWYKLPVGQNITTAPEQGVLVVSTIGEVSLPSTARWSDGPVLDCRWGAATHATFTPHGTILHAARRDGKFLNRPWLPTKTWGTVETNIFGEPIGKWESGKSEPSYTGNRLAWCESNGVHVGGCVFPPLEGRPLDPSVSPDGTRVCWIENAGTPPVNWSVVVAEIATGASRVVVPARDWWMITNARWMNDTTLVAGMFDPNATVEHWALVAIDVASGIVEVLTGPEHGSFLCPVFIR